MSVRIGVMGIGFMGSAHLNCHRKNPAAQVVAICDIDRKKLAGDWSAIGGNIAAGGKVDLSGIRTYTHGEKLLADPDIDVIDITLPTYLHAEWSIKAMRAGKHVFCEKPMARTSADARKMLAVSRQTRRRLFIGQCLRFWPGYGEARDIIRGGKYGKLISATFRRMSQLPTWGWQNWLQDDAKSGLCALDMHIHDSDYVLWALGAPKRLTAYRAGFKKGRIDHIVVSYDYGPNVLVTTEGAWEHKPSFGFEMSFVMAFEKASLVLRPDGKLMLHPAKGAPQQLKIAEGDGYTNELRDYVNCVARNKDSRICTPAQAVQTVMLVEAEVKSALMGRPVAVNLK